MPDEPRFAASAVVTRERIGALSESRLDWHLDNWTEYMRDQRTDYGYGFPMEDTSGAQCYSSLDNASMVEEADMRCAIATDTVIRKDLTPVQSIAVQHLHLGVDFQAVYRLGMYRDEPIDIYDAYRRAREYLSVALIRKGIAW